MYSMMTELNNNVLNTGNLLKGQIQVLSPHTEKW